MTAKLNFTLAVNIDSGASNRPPPEALILLDIDILQPRAGRPSPLQEVAV